MSNSRQPPLDQLRTFFAVYKAGSFSDAARQMGLSQPTVTNHIGSLEQWFGRELFRRGGHGAAPTAFAHETAATLADHVDRIERFLVGEVVSSTGSRVVTVGGPHEFIGSCVIPALASVAEALPRIEFSIGPSGMMLDDVHSGKLDLAISTVRPHGLEVQAWPLADEEFWLVGVPSMARDGASVSQLSKLPFVSYNRDLAIVRRYWNTMLGADPIFDAKIVVPDLLSVKAAVVAGLGISVLPSYLIHREVADGTLVKLLDSEEAPINTVFLCAQSQTWRSREHVRTLAEVILGNVKAYLGPVSG
ncbi:LysR family transcriptional regulator [Gordonia sp. ABSL1-1]|uniref:LysR family transcriptional regulator n=1 Tax=Gordonia sp. ABSL1-1 TaxID=3053923 RepID=UPI00257275AC|nr:LysR family transcriptional regulator [Gordonia sp. ABSL1-1]MDL9935544.1 LysR family transcriptional regulator [Gordonia sp. ABSL1-1]